MLVVCSLLHTPCRHSDSIFNSNVFFDTLLFSTLLSFEQERKRRGRCRLPTAHRKRRRGIQEEELKEEPQRCMLLSNVAAVALPASRLPELQFFIHFRHPTMPPPPPSLLKCSSSTPCRLTRGIVYHRRCAFQAISSPANRGTTPRASVSSSTCVCVCVRERDL